MPGFQLPFPALPNTMVSLPSQNFDALISLHGQRISWRKSHSCPCVWAGGGANGRLPELGSPQPGCLRCQGLGTYWDNPSYPFSAYIEFIHASPTPDEPGVGTNDRFGAFQSVAPSLTLPYANPRLQVGDPGQPTQAWIDASTDDMFVPVDMLARYTAVLQAGIRENLPFQQNVQISPANAVTVWDPATSAVVTGVPYMVSGATVSLQTYPVGTNYMVEFQAAPLYVAFRAAGGLPHVRPLGGGTQNEPRRFHLQALDFWTRQRNLQPQAAGSTRTGGVATPMFSMLGVAGAAGTLGACPSGC